MNPQPELEKLTGLFAGAGPLIERAEHVPQALVPEPYRTLLAHHEHMTVTMERYYGTAVTVEVLDRERSGAIYARKILLHRADNGRVVQFGIVRFDLSYVTEDVRREIESEATPLGRVLIQHNVLRHVDLGAVLAIMPGPELRNWLGVRDDEPVYGRLATIFCNSKPAVDLLEIAAPVNGGSR